MKKLIDTFKNIWAIDELKSKILVTLALVLTYRIGAQITLPGINPLAIEAAQKAGRNNGLLGIFDMFAGCLLYTSPSPRDGLLSRMPSSA